MLSLQVLSLPVAKMKEQKVFLRLAYDGSSYHGWQNQNNAIAVQSVLEAKLSLVLGRGVRVNGCGRTDTGVHALEYFADVMVPDSVLDDPGFVFRFNGFLPKDIVVKQMIPVGPESSARYDAISRTYEYRILRERDPFEMNRAWYLYGGLSMNEMEMAAPSFIGEHDFSAFCKAGSDEKHRICVVTEATWHTSGDIWTFRITANRFVRNMVRAIVGTLVEVGQGKRKAESMKALLLKGDREEAGSSAPAHGLYLSRVEYPAHVFSRSGLNVSSGMEAGEGRQ